MVCASHRPAWHAGAPPCLAARGSPARQPQRPQAVAPTAAAEAQPARRLLLQGAAALLLAPAGCAAAGQTPAQAVLPRLKRNFQQDQYYVSGARAPPGTPRPAALTPPHTLQGGSTRPCSRPTAGSRCASGRRGPPAAGPAIDEPPHTGRTRPRT